MRLSFILVFLWATAASAQNNLLSEIPIKPSKLYAEASFKGLKVVNFESTKLIEKGQLTFVVAHRFGSIENGFDNFFGLDNAVTRIRFIYGLFDGINIAASRTSYQDIYDLSIKYRIARQVKNGFPVKIVGFNSIFVNTGLDKAILPKLRFEHRLGYTTQLLVSRKITQRLSLELMPTFFHNNYVSVNGQDNSQFAIGIGERYKIGKHWSINIDYGWHLKRASESPFVNPLSIGVDIETGGHVFQLLFSNSQPMITNMFLSRAAGDWTQGHIYFGFNLSRYF